ncbi:MAG: DUF533 domain-containing protein [Rhodobacteraceae bacterium]|nr:DUF533 domain-containing protein [Paracoccaceae bacterium]
MSFMRTLATVAVGFAAAKGVQKYRQMGGMAGMQDMFSNASAQGGMADQLGQMADKMGIPGGSKAVKDMMASFGMGGPGGTNEAAAAGFGGLMSAFKGAATASGQQMDDMMSGMFKNTPVSLAAENNAKLMIRAMIQAAKADGEIDKDEQKTIMDALKGQPKEEVDFVKKELAAPVDVMSLANDATEATKAQVYATSLMAIRVDNSQEVSYLRQLATALGMDDAARDRVHAAMGVAPLPAA